MTDPKIIDIQVHDVRFPTSLWHVGSDSMHHPCPNHACTYVILLTSTEYKGYGIAATLGRGNEFVVQTCKLMFELVRGRTITEIYSDFSSFWRQLTTDVELRYLGPECGVVHLATAAIVNALWDLWARIEDKPVWKLLTDMTPEQLVSTVDFRYISDVVTKEEAIQMLKENQPHKEEKEKILQSKGYPTYTADIGWWSFSNQQIKSACKKFKKLDFTNFKTSVGPKIPESVKRCQLIRSVVGGKVTLMVDANQIWDKDQAIASVKGFNKTRPNYIEEPTSSDDVLGHIEIVNELKNLKPYPVRVTCGETCANRVLFKQFLKYGGIDFWNINVGRLGGVNEALAVYFMARKHDKPVWGHAGGVGLGEMIQHLQIWNSICLDVSTDTGMIEYVSHQHGYFKDPVFIRNAHYLLPKCPGFSTQLKDKCIARWSYTEGTRWKYLFKKSNDPLIKKKTMKNELQY